MARPTHSKPIYPYQLANDLRYNKYMFESFKGGQQPLFLKIASGLPALPTAGQGTISYGLTPGGNYVELFESTAQTLFPVGVAGSGLNVACDLVENEALELVPGGNSSSSRLAFTIGTDPDFLFRVKYKITDVSGMDQAILAGFRKQEAYAVPTSLLTTGDGIYTDFCGIGLSEEDGVDLKIMSDLNNAGSTVVTDTLFDTTDAQVLEVEMRVIGRKAIFLINGVRLGDVVRFDGDGTAITAQSTNTGPVFTLDSGDVVVPWYFGRHDDEVGEGTHIVEWECGHLRDQGKDPNNE